MFNNNHISIYSIVTVLSLATFAVAAPSRNFVSNLEAKRDVWAPAVTSPTSLSIWTTGSEQTVTWDLSQMPPGKANSTGLLLLGYFTGNSSTGENLNLNNPLDSSVPLGDGQVTITVPQDIDTKTTYIVVLIGDSGNASPEFTILNTSL